MAIELILNEIEKNKVEYINFLRELVQTESYNPPGNEKNVALKIENFLTDSGIKTEIFPFSNNRANLIAYLNDNFKGRNLLYNGHMDVVPPGNEEEWKNPPLSAYIKRNKYMYGRGTSDMKGGLAAMTVALKILKKISSDYTGNLILNAVADEETGGKLGTKWCLNNKLKNINIDFAIISEPSGLDPLPKAIILGEKGRFLVKIITYGVATHSGWPFMGKNAILMMNKIISGLDRIDEYVTHVDPPMPLTKIKILLSRAFPNEEIFEKVFAEQPLLNNVLTSLTQFTKSVNIINGGIKDNVVPDRCEVVIDFRLLPNQDPNDILKALKKLIEEDIGYPLKDPLVKSVDDIYVDLKILQQSEGSYWKTWEESSTLKELQKTIDDVYEKNSFFTLMPQSADSNYLRNDGFCPQTVIFGPGKGSSVHAANEFIEIEDYLKAIKVFTLFAYHFLT
ncbi:MAG: M20 family metallopeptidase [Promethearchaeota archaeon]